MAWQTLQAFTYGLAYAASDSSDIPLYQNRPADAIWVGTAGNAVCVLRDSSTVTFGCAAGSILPMSQLKRINSGSTTAGGFVALWQL